MDVRTRARFKSLVRDRLVKFIYDPVDLYHKRELAEIIVENDALVGVQYHGFIYRNKFHTQSVYVRPPQNIPRLFESLHGRMDKMLDEQKLIELEERPLVLGYLQKWLNSSNDPTVLFQRLPTALRVPFQQVIAENGWDLPATDMDDAAHTMGIGERSLDALKLRLMTNLIQGDR